MQYEDFVETNIPMFFVSKVDQPLNLPSLYERIKDNVHVLGNFRELREAGR